MQFPEITRQYGFERIPVEKWLDMALQNRIEVMDIRMKWMLQRLMKEPEPVKETMVECPKCKHVFPLKGAKTHVRIVGQEPDRQVESSTGR